MTTPPPHRKLAQQDLHLQAFSASRTAPLETQELTTLSTMKPIHTSLKLQTKKLPTYNSFPTLQDAKGADTILKLSVTKGAS